VTARGGEAPIVLEELPRGTRGTALDEWLTVRNALDLWSMSPDGFALREAAELDSLRLGARVAGRLVAVGQVAMDAFQAEQHEATIRIYVLPDHRRGGIGSAMSERLRGFVRERKLTTVISRVDADDPVSLEFAQRRGLKVHGMQQLGTFDLAGVDLERAPRLSDDVALAAFEERPDLQRSVYELLATVMPEVPTLADLAPPSYAVFQEMLAEPSFRRDLSLVALDDEGIVGYIEVADDGDGRAFISMLAVAPRARRRGIARGLKEALAVRAAKAGWRELVTLNDGTNERIRALNESLGYRYLPESLLLIGPVDPA
jgi:ribosomal protein S18 acetylase RimI-like enzyme